MRLRNSGGDQWIEPDLDLALRPESGSAGSSVSRSIEVRTRWDRIA